MPSVSSPQPKTFTPVAPTKENLDYADLPFIDFALLEQGEKGKVELAKTLDNAMRTQGFFYVINHGLSEEEIQRQVNIGWTILQDTPIEEKKALEGKIQETGQYRGFKLRNYYQLQNGVVDKIEQYNWARDMKEHTQPTTMKPFQQETQEFTEYVHKHILYNLLRLFGKALELPTEEYLVDRHRFEKFDESWMRYMAYYDEHSDDDLKKTKGVWLMGHADFGSLTLLFSQPMSSLQVRQADGTWRWVRHVPGAIVVNAGEMMQFWTGGYYKATVHRVHQPPTDQRGHSRCGVFYFVVPNDEVKINTLLDESPVLKKAGVKQWFEPGKEPTSGGYSRARISTVGKSSVHKGGWEGVREEVVGGVVTKWYTE